MPTVKISELSATSTLDDTSIFPVVKSGTTYKVTNANLKVAMLTNVPGANVTGTLSNTVTGNITTVGTLGSLTVTANVIAGNVVVGGGSGGNIAGANVVTANTINTKALTANGAVSLGAVGNITITGGSNGYVLGTNGSGTLSWVAQTGGGGSYGDSNVGTYLANYSGNLSAANLTVSSVPNFSSTGYMLVPKGTTGQRPGSGVAGYVRYNTDLGVLECYNAQGAWQPAGGYKHVTVSSSTYTSSAWDFCWTDTTSAAITITLPASPAKGDTIRFVDVANNFGTNNLTIARNGQKLQGDTTDMTVSVSGAAFDLIYYNSTYGWRTFSV